MKLISWNVNGLRACLQKGFLDFFSEADADCFCLQETKLQADQVSVGLPGYRQYWNYAEKKGYSGTAIFTKAEPLSVRYGIGVAELDTEGRLITLEFENFFLLTCYTPNAQRELARIGHRLSWDKAFRDYVSRLDSEKPVVICGDLNVAHKEIDLKNPASNRGNAGFSDEERAKMIKHFVDRGYIKQIFISCDIDGRTLLKKWGGWGYSHLLTSGLLQLRKAGLSWEEIDQITHVNPREFLRVRK